MISLITLIIDDADIVMEIMKYCDISLLTLTSTLDRYYRLSQFDRVIATKSGVTSLTIDDKSRGILAISSLTEGLILPNLRVIDTSISSVSIDKEWLDHHPLLKKIEGIIPVTVDGELILTFVKRGVTAMLDIDGEDVVLVDGRMMMITEELILSLRRSLTNDEDLRLFLDSVVGVVPSQSANDIGEVCRNISIVNGNMIRLRDLMVRYPNVVTIVGQCQGTLGDRDTIIRRGMTVELVTGYDCSYSINNGRVTSMEVQNQQDAKRLNIVDLVTKIDDAILFEEIAEYPSLTECTVVLEDVQVQHLQVRYPNLRSIKTIVLPTYTPTYNTLHSSHIVIDESIIDVYHHYYDGQWYYSSNIVLPACQHASMPTYGYNRYIHDVEGSMSVLFGSGKVLIGDINERLLSDRVEMIRHIHDIAKADVLFINPKDREIYDKIN